MNTYICIDTSVNIFSGVVNGSKRKEQIGPTKSVNTEGKGILCLAAVQLNSNSTPMCVLSRRKIFPPHPK